MPVAPELSIALLGPPVVSVDGRPLAVDTRKATALLAYLTITARPVRRDTLAALLWPDTDPERARATLRRTLSTLRSGLEGRWLVAERDTVVLDRDGVWFDADEFEALIEATETHGHGAHETCPACQAPLEAAVLLHRGDFLAGFGLRDAPDFDDWQLLVADGYRRSLGKALDRLARAHAEADDFARAIAVARRRLALDVLHEPAHRQLIELYAWSENRSAAIEQYRECVRTLSRELGVSPLDETTTLYHSVLEGAAVPAPRRLVSAPAVPLAALPLVGREAEWRTLASARADARKGGRLLVLEGEAGIGKTRLAEELVNRARSEGATAILARGYAEETGLAYGVAAELLRSLPESMLAGVAPWEQTEVARLLPELGPAPVTALDGEAAQSRFYDALAGVLVPDSEIPPVVVVDDAHWADDASLGLVAYLVHRLRTRRVLLVLTWRPEEVPAQHSVRTLVRDAVRNRIGEILTLGRLTAKDVEQLVAATGQDAELARRLHRETAGLPFFVVEYLEAIGRRDTDGATEGGGLSLPGGVRDLLRSRLSGLDELAAQVVAAAAVLGHTFESEILRDASGRTDDETVRAIEQLVGAGVLVEETDGYAFRHEQARALVLHDMSLARRRLLHRRVAEALALRARGAAGEALVARHLAEAGRDAEAAERFRAAGDAARRLYANGEALAHYRSALALGHPATAALRLEIGDLETLAGDYGAAVVSYEAAVAETTRAEAPLIEHRIGLLYLRRGEWELADASLASAIAAAGAGRPLEEGRMLADRSLALHRLGRPAEAAALAAAALEHAELARDTPGQAQALNILGILAAATGAHDEALRYLKRSLTLAEAAGDPAARVAALNNLALSHRAQGATTEALELTAEALALCSELGDRHREAALRNNLADLLRAEGRDAEAIAELKRAVAIFAEVGEPGKLEPEIWKLSEW